MSQELVSPVTVAELQAAKVAFEDDLGKYIGERVRQFEARYRVSLDGIMTIMQTGQSISDRLPSFMHAKVEVTIRLW